MNQKQNGYVILDTGAYCSAISTKAARLLGGSLIFPEVQFAAGTGAATGQRVASIVHFTIAAQDFVPNEVVALDLSNLSRHCGVEVMGVLAYPALINYVLNVDYRNGRVKIERTQSNSTQDPPSDYKSTPLGAPAIL